MFRLFNSGGARYSLKTRLYSIIAFLGLLPVLGVALALVAVELSRRDDAALDRVARGTINLERVNGLVYAVVMESRGIYMSADWTAAEPFAKNLNRQLGELQDVARAWKSDAIASQQSNIEDLAERIDQFVRFRTELVRLGKEESAAAARAFGDNDANRTVRTALNNSLHTVARAYEQEIARARSQVEADERHFLAILLAVAVLGAMALAGGLLFVKAGLLTPVLKKARFDAAAVARRPRLRDRWAAARPRARRNGQGSRGIPHDLGGTPETQSRDAIARGPQRMAPVLQLLGRTLPDGGGIPRPLASRLRRQPLYLRQFAGRAGKRQSLERRQDDAGNASRRLLGLAARTALYFRRKRDRFPVLACRSLDAERILLHSDPRPR
jgi:hypothetical protein